MYFEDSLKDMLLAAGNWLSLFQEINFHNPLN